MEKLKISQNRRYFVTSENRPFIWIADTAWTLPQRIKWDDVEYYIKKRKSQGFTVLQIVALDPERDVEMRSPVGDKALLNDSLATPNEKYFEYLDWILEKAEEYGFYVLLLPVWGQLVVGENWLNQTFPKTVNEDNAYGYGEYIGKRYKDKKHILWCLGGDRQPIHKNINYKNVWRRMAEGLAKGVLGEDLKYNENPERWEELLITYHPCFEAETGECSTMSYWDETDSWISYIMVQSGHGISVKNYEIIEKEYNRDKKMPVWDGEPAYEMMPTTWPVIESFHGDWIVRKRAYWSLFAGAFGHTYGHASVWCSVSEREKNHFSKYSWIEALDHLGAFQIKVLRDFMESVDVEKLKPCQEALAEQNKKEDILDEHIQAAFNYEDKKMYIYFPSGGTEIVELSRFNGTDIQLWWFEPKSGNFKSEEPEEFLFMEVLSLTTPTKGEGNDWICIIEEKDNEKLLPVKKQEYFIDDNIESQPDKVFEW